MQRRKYAQKVPVIVADMERERQEDERERQPDQDAERQNILYAYPITIGGVQGVVHTREEIASDYFTETIDAQPATDTRSAITRPPPSFLHFLLVLFLFIGLDNVDSFFTMLAPTVTVTITPQVKTISTTATITVGGAGAEVQGRVLAPLTLSQEQTVSATGRGHQDATIATGAVTFYNGQLQSITVSSGTVFTGRDGIQIVTTTTADIPAADEATNPPTFGHVSVSASAVHPGASGNVQAFDISGSCCAASMIVKNLAPFENGQDARDFTIVTHADRDQPAATLKAQVTQSMQAAFQGQVRAGEQLLVFPCSPTTIADHRVGDEATHVHITVAETCTALTYNTHQLTSLATARLTTHATTQLGAGYTLDGNVTITQETTRATNNKQVVLVFSARGTWVYQITETQIQALILGKPRLTALHLLAALPGIQTVSIAGVSDNQQLPTDTAHIHLLIVIEGERTWARQRP